MKKEKKKAEEKPANTVQEFVNNQENRQAATEKAVHLWNIVTGRADTKLAEGSLFETTRIVHLTNLSHSTLRSLLELLEIFGLIEYTREKREFRFVFDEKIRRENIRGGLIEIFAAAEANYQRLLSTYEDEKEREEAREELNKYIDELFKK